MFAGTASVAADEAFKLIVCKAGVVGGINAAVTSKVSYEPAKIVPGAEDPEYAPPARDAVKITSF